MQLAAIQHLAETNTIVLGIVFLGCVLSIWLFNLALAPSDSTTRRRIRALSKRQEELRAHRESLLLRRKQRTEKLSKLARAVAGKSSLNQESLTEIGAKLGQAGYRSRHAVSYFVAIQLAMLVGTPLAAFIVLQIMAPDTGLLEKLLGALAAGIIGFFLPKLVLSHKAEGRIERIKKAFPDAVDMLVVCTEAGLGMDTAIKRVSQEMYTGAPDMSEELAATLMELSFFDDRSKAFMNMQKRIPLSLTRTFANTMIQTERFGTPLSQSLRTLSDEFRKDRLAEAETKVAKLATKMIFPIVIFMFLPLIAVIVFPAVIQMSDNWIN